MNSETGSATHKMRAAQLFLWVVNTHVPDQVEQVTLMYIRLERVTSDERDTERYQHTC